MTTFSIFLEIDSASGSPSVLTPVITAMLIVEEMLTPKSKSSSNGSEWNYLVRPSYTTNFLSGAMRIALLVKIIPPNERAMAVT